MYWGLLLLAIVFEVIGTTFLKKSAGFSQLGPTFAMFLAYSLSFAALCFAIQRIPIGVGYAIWSGLGTAMIATIGMTYFGEEVSPVKIACLTLIIVGVIGLKLWDKPEVTASQTPPAVRTQITKVDESPF